MKQASPNGTTKESDSTNPYLSLESASLALAILLLSNDKNRQGQLIALALRQPDIIRDLVQPLLSAVGNFQLPMPTDNVIPSTKEELITIVEPILKEGTKLASFARLFDLYLLRNPPTPDSIVYTLYTVIRFVIAQENKPTPAQHKLIWSTTLLMTKKSAIGGKQWQELEASGEVYLDDWLAKVKENARKRFRTFVNQKQKMERRSDDAFKRLFVLFFE